MHDLIRPSSRGKKLFRLLFKEITTNHEEVRPTSKSYYSELRSDTFDIVVGAIIVTEEKTTKGRLKPTRQASKVQGCWTGATPGSVTHTPLGTLTHI